MKTEIFRPKPYGHRYALAIITAAILFAGCQKQQTLKNGQIPPPVSTSLLAGKIDPDVPFVEGSNTILGKSKQNPYTVKNMTAAWDVLLKRGIVNTAQASVRTTHYYVKFKPQNSDQYEALHQDSALALSDYPIESNITQNGDYYHDTGLPDSIPTYQYTAVKVDYKLPDTIPYEILGNLYIPETDDKLQYENGGADDIFVDRLLNQAYTQTANYDDTIAIADPAPTQLNRFTPGGRIRIFDTRLQTYIGMEGVRVQARRWFVIYNGYPDFNGNYRMNHSFKRPCNYSIWFATDRFAVRHNLVNTTFWVNGPKITGDWNYDLNNSYQRFAGHVFRGGYRYHNKDIGGLQRPFRPSGNRTVYIAKDAGGNESGVNWIVFPVIKVWRYGSNGAEYNSDEIFSTTCHETGHTSHVIIMNAGVIQFIQVDNIVRESWAIAIEWYLTHIEYANRGINNYGNFDYFPANGPQYPNSYAYQYWSTSASGGYTGVFIDIVDNYNQLGQVFPQRGVGTVNDQVQGYTLPQIESSMLKHIYASTSLSNQLKANKPVGVTDAQIDLLVNFW